MKKVNKITSILLTVIMLLTAVPVAYAADSDGEPTVIDVSTLGNYYAVYEEDYDPDGYVLTGYNPEFSFHDCVGVDVTFKDLTMNYYFIFSNNTGSVTLTLSGDNTFLSSCDYAIANNDADVIINAEENATLTVTTSGFFISNNGWGGELTVNGGDISIVLTPKESGSHAVNVPYTQNGGNVTLSTQNNYVFYHDVVLNGGTLNASTKGEYVARLDITVAPGASFKATSDIGMLGRGDSKFLIAEGAPENSCFVAKTSADGEHVTVKDTSTLNAEKYLELKVEAHVHSFENADECVCGADKADYSGYYAAMERYNEITDEYADKLIDETKDYISTEIQKIVDEYLGGTGVKNNYSEDEQYILDGIEEGVNKICDTLEAGIADGTLIKPDYTAIEARIAELEQTHSGEEYQTIIAEIKAELDAIKATNPETHADVAEDIAQLESKIDGVLNCTHICHNDGWFMNFIWTIANFIHSLLSISPVCDCGAVHY